MDAAIRRSVTNTTRTYDDEQTWLDEVADARIRLGFHLRDATDDAREIGRGIAEAVVEDAFPPVGR